MKESQTTKKYSNKLRGTLNNVRFLGNEFSDDDRISSITLA